MYNPFILFFLFITINNAQIKLKFKRYYPKKEIYFNSIIINDILTEIKLGTPSQNLTLSIRMLEYPTFVLNTSANSTVKNTNKFSEKNSSTFIELRDYSIIYGDEAFKKAYLGRDIFDLNNNKANANLMIASDIENDIKFFDYSWLLPPSHSGVLGLNLFPQFESLQNTSLLLQLYKEKIIDFCSFSFIFQNNDQGYLILGKDFYYDENKYLFRKTELLSRKETLTWGIIFDNITFGNETIENTYFKAKFKVELNMILTNNYMKEAFKNIFFQQYFEQNLCIQNKTDDNYTIYFICDKNINIQKFPEIKFYMKDIDFELVLNYKDLFIEKDNKIYFLIIFQKDNKIWELGAPLFKKYPLIFDMDKKIIIFEKNKNTNYIIYFMIFLIILILMLVLFIFRIIKKRNNRVKAIELDSEVNENYLNSTLI